MPSCARSVWWVEACRLFDVTGMGLADEFCPVFDQHRFERFGGEGAIGVGNTVEPGLAEAVPFGIGRNASVNAAESQAPQTGKLTHDLGVPACPVRKELLARQAGFSADEADASDHGSQRLGGRWNNSSVMAS